MFEQLLFDKKFYFILLFWVALGLFTGPLVYVVVPVHLLMLHKKGEWLVVLLGLWLMLILSDSRQGMFRFAQNVKPIVMALLGLLFFFDDPAHRDWRFFKGFILFFLIAFYCWLESPVAFDSFQRTASYAVLLVVVPWLVNRLLLIDRDRFLYHLVMLGALVLMVGAALRFVSPGIVIFMGERYSGLLGNPNGLGIFSFMFFSLFTIIITHHPRLFSLAEIVVVYLFIALSLAWAGSRGGIFSSLLFLAGWYLFRKSTLMGFVVMTLVFVSYQVVMDNFVDIVNSLGLQSYFRLETLDSGSGRTVAREIAWKEIQNNYWLSKGFGYNVVAFSKYADYFMQHGHQGNVHNSWLTIWLDVGLLGLIAFCWGWLRAFMLAASYSPVVWAVLYGLLLSTTVESWLAASLNPFTIQLVMILSLLGNPGFYENDTV